MLFIAPKPCISSAKFVIFDIVCSYVCSSVFFNYSHLKHYMFLCLIFYPSSITHILNIICSYVCSSISHELLTSLILFVFISVLIFFLNSVFTSDLYLSSITHSDLISVLLSFVTFLAIFVLLSVLLSSFNS